MTAIHLHDNEHVGTTYKRALTRINPVRDYPVSDRLDDSTALEAGRYYHQRMTFQWRTSMRKPRDFDSELKALADKAKQLKERRVQQLGELVIATGADATDAETLAGALLVIAETSETQRKEAWRKRGAAFFQNKARKRGDGTERFSEGTLPLGGGAASA
jgi:DNA-binding protein H-NS